MQERMNNYARAAIRAVELYKSHRMASPRQVWEEATAEIFGWGTPSQVKACPRDAFLGLCEEGLIRSIPRGQYTKSSKNKRYALDAVTILKGDPRFVAYPSALWKKVVKGARKAHNQQMDVVIALRGEGLLAE